MENEEGIVSAEVEAASRAMRESFFGGRRARLVGDGDYIPAKEVKPLERERITPEQMKQERKNARVRRKQAREETKIRKREEEEEEGEISQPFSGVAKVERMAEEIFDPDEAKKRVLRDRKKFLEGTVGEILERNSLEMILLKMAIITGERTPLGIRAAEINDWLDRAGYSKIEQIKANIAAIPDKELKVLREAAKKSKELQDKKVNQLVLGGKGEKEEDA